MAKTKKTKAENEYTSHLIDDLANAITPEQQAHIDAKMKLAAKIYNGLKAKGWTQTQLAHALNKQVSVISKWLSGTHNFTLETLVEIERTLNISLLDIEKYDDCLQH